MDRETGKAVADISAEIGRLSRKLDGLDAKLDDAILGLQTILAEVRK